MSLVPIQTHVGHILELSGLLSAEELQEGEEGSKLAPMLSEPALVARVLSSAVLDHRFISV